ncbi:MAG: hypothetical protein EA358_03535 [Flavobacteriales bacterium]|nr:MAG: hypothetical protein EA358_03535 [Flavobacteriales bacterium]
MNNREDLDNKDRMPEAQRQALFKGITLMFASLPFVFAGPSLLFALGVPRLRHGHYDALIASVVVMIIAGVIGVSGLRRVLKAFFEKR